MQPTFLVTGGAGFIGSAVVRMLVREHGARVVTVDRLTYAGSPDPLAELEGDARHRLERVDVCDGPALGELFRAFRPDAVLHLAAESHVDRSIGGPAVFVRTNVQGTFTLLEEARRYRDGLDAAGRERFRLVHVSTDEVFGEAAEGAFTEDSPYRPSSPYSASKAAADHLARAWHRTYGLPVVLTMGSNTYGPWQFPEKLVPLMVLNALEGRPLPVYGDGGQVRDWLWVDDHAAAIVAALRRGRPGASYCVGGGCERRNLEVVRALCRLVDELAPHPAGPAERGIRFVADRPGHDLRYALDTTRARAELGWAPRMGFDEGLRRTVAWYVAHRGWAARMREASAGEGRGGGA